MAESETGRVAGMVGAWTPVPRTFGYQASVLLVAGVVVCLPLAYVALIGGVGWAVWWHLTSHAPPLQESAGPRGAALGFSLYLAPALIGLVVIVFMLKPLVLRPGRAAAPFPLYPTQEPRLFNFVWGVCEVIGAPTPKRIDVTCEVNASASFRRGWLSVLGPADLVLTLGMPLVAGMRATQLAGVLAHELAHFRQGVGMRASFVVRSILAWLDRVANQRDALDLWLLEASGHESPVLLRVLALAARACVGASRLVLHGLLLAGCAVAALLMRQMEHDADWHEARLVGSGVMAENMRRLGELSLAMEAAEVEAASMFRRDRQLPDDLASLVAAAADRLVPEDHDRIERRMREERTGVFDTHPSAAERIRVAMRRNEPGVFRDDRPASALLSDPKGASRTASYALYKERLGGGIEEVTFVPAERLLSRRGTVGGGVLASYVGLDPPAQRPLVVPLAELVAPEDPRRALARLREARASRERIGPEAERAGVAFREAGARLASCLGAQALMDAGVATLPKALGLGSASRQGVGEEISRIRDRMALACDTIDPALEVAGARLAASLSLLMVRGADAQVEDGAARRARAADLLAIVRGIHAQRARASAARELIWRGQGLIEGLKARQKPEPIIKALKVLVAQLHGHVIDLRRDLGGLPALGQGEGHNLGSELGAFGDSLEPQEVPHAAADFLRRYDETQRACVAELVAIGLAVERALGLADVSTAGSARGTNASAAGRSGTSGAVAGRVGPSAGASPAVADRRAAHGPRNEPGA